MLRRSFFQRLLGLPAVVGVGSLPPTAKPPERHRLVLLEAFVAGFRFHRGPEVLALLEQGQALQLVREPDNPQDAHAVRIEWRSQKLGYVPRRDRARIVTDTLAQGAAVRAEIAAVDRAARPWEQVRFTVWLVGEGKPPDVPVPAMASAADDAKAASRRRRWWSS